MNARGNPVGAIVILLLVAATLGNMAVPVRRLPDIVSRTGHGLTIESLPALETSGIPTLARFRAAADRPPFLRGRRPIVSGGGVGIEASDSDDELGRLLAIGLTSKDEIILLNPVDFDRTIVLRLGDQIKGWSVSIIEKNLVRFTKDQQVVVLHLKEANLADGRSGAQALSEAE